MDSVVQAPFKPIEFLTRDIDVERRPDGTIVLQSNHKLGGYAKHVPAILAKWAALILVGIFSLMALASQDLVGFLSLWVTVLFAFGFVRYQQGLLTLPRLKRWQRKPKLRVLPDLEAAPRTAVKPAREDVMAEVDALLDKIAKSGISSLTAKERATLDLARERLKNRGSPRT